MKHSLFLGLCLCSAVVLTGCKSKESAYRQAYEKAKAQEMEAESNSSVAVTPVEEVEREVVVTPVTPVTPPPARQQNTNTTVDHSDVRTIAGGVTVVNGSPLKAYSVVVGSFLTQANAEGLMSTLQGEGYDARVVKTNETINGHTGWFRVVACSFDDKPSAAQSRDRLKAQPSYKGAWLLYNK